MKKFNGKSEVEPAVGRKLFSFEDERENGIGISIAPLSSSRDMLTEIARQVARDLLAKMLECEIAEHLAKYEAVRDEQGHRQVVRNGYCKERKIVTGVGEVKIAQPRAWDKRDENELEKFTSKILPPYLRKAKTVDEFIPILYLRGVSTGDMEATLRALLGENAKRLSVQTVSRLKMQWQEEYETWSKRSLKNKKYVYVWADGVYFTPRGDESKVCMLVIIDALEDGTKEAITISDGFRESEQSWSEVLPGLKNRGLEHAPMLAIGDGALGFWNAIRKIFPETKEQRGLFHKKGNVLTQLPRQSARQGEKYASRDRTTADPRTGMEADETFGKRVRREISEGGRMLDERSERTAHVLRFPVGTLAEPENDESD